MLTVGELKEILNDVEADAKVYIKEHTGEEIMLMGILSARIEHEFKRIVNDTYEAGGETHTFQKAEYTNRVVIVI